MNKFLVTGGAGFIGSHLVDHLIKEGQKVVVLDDLSGGVKENLSASISSIKFVNGSVLNRELLDQLCETVDGIFHLAAHTSVQKSIQDPYLSHELNTLGILNVLETAKKNGIKVIYASSSAYYGNSEHLPYQEKNIPMPLSPYAAQKVLGEYYCQIYHDIHNLSCIGLRFFNVYGPRQTLNGGYAGVIKIFMDKIKNQQPLMIHGNGDQTRDFVYVEDVVRACILAMQSDLNVGFYNVGVGKEITINEIAGLMLELLGLNFAIRHSHQKLLGDALRSQACTQKTERELKFKAFFDIREGLSKTLKSCQFKLKN